MNKVKDIARKYGKAFIIRCPKCNSRKLKKTNNIQIMSCAKCGYTSGGFAFIEDVNE